MKQPNFRACLLATIFLGCIGGIAVDTAMKSKAAAEQRTRLVGLACGPDRLTLTAVEEDEFPFPCEAIETPETLCGHGDADECAAYMGDGY